VAKSYGDAWSTIASAEEKVKPEIKTVLSTASIASSLNTALQSFST